MNKEKLEEIVLDEWEIDEREEDSERQRMIDPEWPRYSVNLN